jgi:hypothetical protein
MPIPHCFSWPTPDNETASIDYAIQYPAGDVVLFPVNFPDDPSITVDPANLSVRSLDRLIAGVLALADYARNTADRLDETATRLTLMRPVARSGGF